MANHAYLYSTHIPDPDTVDKDLRGFIANKFPMLAVERTDNYWCISHPELDGEAIQMWYQDRDDEYHFAKVAWESHAESEVDEPEPNIAPNDDVLEFRHGHGMRAWWWLESEVRMFLAGKYKCNAYDDGIGEYEEKQEQFENYLDYMRKTTAGHPRIDQLVELEIGMLEEYDKAGIIPDSFRPLLGLS
jgi:hypothetical protein